MYSSTQKYNIHLQLYLLLFVKTAYFLPSGTGGRCCICAGQMLHVHSPGGSIFRVKWRHGRPPSWKCDVMLKIWPSINAIYLKNIPAKFHPDPIWNACALGNFWRGSPQHKQQEGEWRSRNVYKWYLLQAECPPWHKNNSVKAQKKERYTHTGPQCTH